MRCLLQIQMDTPTGNAAITGGTIEKTVQQILDRTHPEACYFGASGGRRTAFVFFDLADPSAMPVITEPAFMGLGAEISITPVMNLEDLRSGLARLGSTG